MREYQAVNLGGANQEVVRAAIERISEKQKGLVILGTLVAGLMLFGRCCMNGLLGGNSWQQMANTLHTLVRRKIFVSYHHGGDQWFYDEFSRVFHDGWETVYDNSLERRIDSDNTAYVMQRIRENHITGTSCTVVLIGGQTHQRKYVDWEVKATLDKGHGLLGIVLPTHAKNLNNQVIVPDRFFHNLNTGYASCIFWEYLTAESLTNAVNAAVNAPGQLISNSLPMKSKNG